MRAQSLPVIERPANLFCRVIFWKGQRLSDLKKLANDEIMKVSSRPVFSKKGKNCTPHGYRVGRGVSLERARERVKVVRYAVQPMSSLGVDKRVAWDIQRARNDSLMISPTMLVLTHGESLGSSFRSHADVSSAPDARV